MGSPLAALLLLASLSGCASLPLFGTSAKIEWADAKNPAATILALWQQSDGPGPNGVPIRGFAGQVYFFTQSKPAPVVVNGKVRIYVFDDRGDVKQQGKPIGEYDFDSANWNARAHRSTLGPGYAIFIPYPRSDFHQTTCSLRVRFIPNEGPTIYSPPAAVVLTGPPVKPVRDETIIQPPPRQPRSQNANAAALTMSIGLPAPRAPYSQNVVPASGTDADARLSLDDDIVAPANDQGGPAQYANEATAQRSGRLRLQSVKPDGPPNGDD